MALASRAVELWGITTVMGNTSLDKIQRNARYLCEVAGRADDVPVYAGCPRPLMSWTNYDPARTSSAFGYVESIHGSTGMGNILFPEPARPLETQHAVSFLVETLRQQGRGAGGPGGGGGSSSRRPVTILATGPLTNLATALVMAPDIRASIDRIVVLGGAMGVGNITPAAEFNFFVDPHAAAVVFDSGIQIAMIGLDVTRQVPVTPAFVQKLREQRTKVSETLVDIIESRPPDHYEPGMTTAVLHDPCVVGYLLAPELFQGRPAYVTVETNPGPCLGRSTVHFSSPQPPNAFVLERIDAVGFYELMLGLLSNY